MIPEAAVEAAARAIHEAGGWDWEDPTGWREICATNEARAALEAAAPHMLAGVTALAEDWEKRGEADIASSKDFEDKDIAMAFLTEGASKVEAARHLRNAIRDTK